MMKKYWFASGYMILGDIRVEFCTTVEGWFWESGKKALAKLDKKFGSAAKIQINAFNRI